MFLSVPCHFSDFRLRNIARIDAGYGFAFLVHSQHEVKRFVLAFVEELHEDEDHVVHRRVVIVVKEDLVATRDVRLLSLFKFGVAAMLRRARGGLRSTHFGCGTLLGRNAYGRNTFVSDTLNSKVVERLLRRGSHKPSEQVS